MKWKVEYYKGVEQQVSDLPKKIIGKYLRLIDFMEENGPNLGMPHTKALKQGLFELRIISGEQSTRAFFCLKLKHEIIILHILVKKTQKTPKKDLEIALNRMREIKND